jgi:hypothetical protein
MTFWDRKKLKEVTWIWILASSLWLLRGCRQVLPHHHVSLWHLILTPPMLSFHRRLNMNDTHIQFGGVKIALEWIIPWFKASRCDQFDLTFTMSWHIVLAPCYTPFPWKREPVYTYGFSFQLSVDSRRTFSQSTNCPTRKLRDENNHRIRVRVKFGILWRD